MCLIAFEKSRNSKCGKFKCMCFALNQQKHQKQICYIAKAKVMMDLVMSQ